MEFEKIIEKSIIENKILKLPDIQLDRKEYLDIAAKLAFLGGKWKTSKKGFVFDREISIEKLLNESGENKKDLQFFETPAELARELVELAEINNYVSILEPSAGRGAIIKAIQEKCDIKVNYCEISLINQEYLDNIAGIEKLGDDFLKIEGKFDRIIANPPFSKNQDIAHIMKMWECLKEGGILVSVASPHWEKASEKKCVAFREFLYYTNAKITKIEAGAFKESGTMIEARIIIIKK